MITKENFKDLLKKLDIKENNNIFTKKFTDFGCELKVDFNSKKLIYPSSLTVNDETTSNFTSFENFVVFECVHRLLTQGYNPKHIELEKKWQLGHTQKSGKADICIKDNNNAIILIIECKTAGKEYENAIKILENDSRNQLFSYLQQATSTKFIALYSSDYLDDKVINNYYLINVTDNEKLLKNDEKLKSYKEGTTVEDKYSVWCETYDKEYSTIGLFENNQAYEIGKTKFTNEDLKDISSKDIQSKYHQFATILRQHNVSGRENAFDKLVNLFLCKVTDEKENPNELKFYYKGKAYDNPFDFQDRLQQLYKIGMDKFLKDKITYISAEQIENAFNIFKDKPNIAKDNIKKYFKELKFFTNNDFAFIDVHNEKLFYQNFEVLLKVSQMIQDIRLTGSEENQFLGDMFEGFLDQGIKQSEGQFFTPMPIVKFIINSLPKKKKPRVIDYACGSGHFLNEYANINKDSQIVGVEKEYRLSKVAKVSSFMYGSDINIIYADALCHNENLKEKSFDVLVANPPYSVKGFLQTLSEEDKKNYELINLIDVKSYAKTGAIECFFIERAKQLLDDRAVVGIIVPSSILNKSNPITYTKTREIILKYFDIVAISEFGSGTFGKTGTNTVTLFLRKKSSNPDISIHYTNMINSWFDNDFESNSIFKDSDLLEKYCSHINIEFDMYKNFLGEIFDEKLFEKEIFKEYKTTFEKLTTTKQRRAKKIYKELNKEKKDNTEKEKLYSYIKHKEKDKLLYFMLSSHQINDVIIVKSPTQTNEIKNFLGYEWGGRKGAEGIKYLTSQNIDIAKSDTELEDEDLSILENLQGLKHINTPLYNPSNIDDSSKINKIIRDNFDNIKTEICEELIPFVQRANLVDMIDFTRVDFDKAISLNQSKKVAVESIYQIKKLEDLIELYDSLRRPIKESERKKGNIPYYGATGIIDFVKGYTHNGRFLLIGEDGAKWGKNENSSFIVEGKFWANNHVHILKAKEIVKDIYLREYLNNTDLTIEYITGLTVKKLNQTNLLNIKVPLPPKDIQEKIVQECEEVDNNEQKANNDIVNSKQKIDDIFIVLEEKKHKTTELKNVATFNIPKSSISNIENSTIASFIEMASVSNDGFILNMRDEQIGDLRKKGYKYFAENDIIVAKITPCMENGKCALVQNLTNGIGFGSTEFHTIRCYEMLLPKFLFGFINRDNIRKEAEKQMTGSSGHRRVPINFYQKLLIPILPIDEQKQIIKKIEILENEIKIAQAICDSSKEKKEKILRKYL